MARRMTHLSGHREGAGKKAGGWPADSLRAGVPRARGLAVTLLAASLASASMAKGAPPAGGARTAAPSVSAPGAAPSPPLAMSIAPRTLVLDGRDVAYEEVRVNWADDSLQAWHPAELDSLRLYLHIPAEFRLVPGSLTLEADTLNVVSMGNPVVADLPMLGRRGRFVIRFSLRPEVDADSGRHVVVGYVRRGEAWMTPSAPGVIDLAPGDGPRETTLIGSIYHDHNHNGRRDPEDEGIAGVGVAIEDGARAVTDDEGRFAFRVFSGTHLVTVDGATLPRGATVIGDPRRLDDASAMDLADLAIPIQSRSKHVVGLGAGGDAEHARTAGKGAAGAKALAPAAMTSPCDALAANPRAAWGGYFDLDSPADRTRFEQLKECRGLPAIAEADAAIVPDAARMPGAPPPASAPTAPPAPAGGAVLLSPHVPDAPPEMPRARAVREARAPRRAMTPEETSPPIALPPSPTPAAPDSTEAARAAASVTLEVGQKMFGLSTDRLTPGYNDMLHTLGALFQQKGIQVGLRPAEEEHRDGPPNEWLEKQRMKAVNTALAEGRKDGLRSPARKGAANEPTPGSMPRATIESMTYAEAKDHARLIITLSGEVPYAEGSSDSSSLLLVLHTAFAPDFHMPEIPEGSMLHRLSLDLSDRNGSLLLISEPGPDVDCRAHTMQKPFRIELDYERKAPAPAGAAGAAADSGAAPGTAGATPAPSASP